MLRTAPKGFPGYFPQYLFYCYATTNIVYIHMEYYHHSTTFWGSSCGWLTISTDRHLILINPLTSASIKIPSPALPRPHRMILTGSPESPDCTVFAIHPQDSGLWFVKPGDRYRCWQPVGHDPDTKWSDVICFKGEIYGCTSYGCLYVLHMSNASDFAEPPESIGENVDKKYLVDVGGELCMIVRRSHRFEVHKIDMCTRRWTRVTSLGVCLFVGDFSANFATEACGNLKPNCIYYTEEDGGDFEKTVYQIEIAKLGEPEPEPLPLPPRVTPPDDEYVAVSSVWMIPSL